MSSDIELRAALEWQTGTPQPQGKGVFEWLWEAIQGDFNDNRSAGQIAFDTGISMIPLVDQVCDARDLIANCRAIANSEEGEDNTWKWVALALTLIGLFPTLGSLVKGVLKMFFLFVRRYGMDHLIKAVDDGMTWVVSYLRKPEVQRYLRERRVDEVFHWLAQQVKTVKNQLSAASLLRAFDRGIGVLQGLLGKVTALPVVGRRAQATLEMVQGIRRTADRPIAWALGPVRRVLDAVIHRMEMESLVQRSGVLDVRNVHFRGALPESRAVTLMKTAEPPPAWLGRGRAGRWPEQDPKRLRGDVDDAVADGWPSLTDQNIRSFHRMEAVEIQGPAKLFRVVSPSNGAMGDCWIPEDVWHKIQAAPDPKAAWRKYLGVWPDWNPNGQFVVMEIPPGQSLKVWHGPAASQVKDKDLKLDAHLEGGWDQVIFKPQPGQWDDTRIYQLGGGQGNQLRRTEMSYADYNRLPPAEKAHYVPMRERINHPHIRGPLDTSWGSTDFDPQLIDARIGLPTLPGQVTN
jgi:hypothetical protein